MKELLAWISPPVVGAVIGYVTNDIAIKMLFRPLTEKRVFGVRVPFTPGILPRQRHQLADNIGRMVARELITEEIIRERIRRDDFRLSIERAVADYSSRLLSQPIGKLALEVPPFESGGAADRLGASDLGRLIGNLAERFIASPAFSDIVDRAVAAAVNALGRQSIATLAGSDRAALVRFLGGRFSAFLASAVADTRTGARLEEGLARFIDSLVRDGSNLGSILGSGTVQGIVRAAEAAYPELIEAGLRFLGRREIRAELESHGRVFLRDAIQRLNVFQRFFLSAAQYDRTLQEQMPEIVDDLIAHLASAARGEKGRARFVTAVKDGAERFLAYNLADAAATLALQPQDLAAALSRALGGLLAAEGTGAALTGLLAGFLEDLVDEPLRDVAEKRVGVDVDTVIRSLASAVKGLAAKAPGVAPAAAVDAFLAERGENSLSELLGIDAEGKDKFDRFVADRVLALIDERISAALSTLDVRTLVADRIDSLDMESVESIVLDILANQLRWINVFGAILGAVIGLSQAALSLFLR